MLIHKSRLSAYTVYLLFSGATSLSFSIIFTVNMVYQVEVAKLNPLQLVLVGTVLESAAFICQVPTGVLADMYSRRLAVSSASLCLGWPSYSKARSRASMSSWRPKSYSVLELR